MLTALLTQDVLNPTDKILVVDNASTDNSVEIAERFGGVRVLHQPKRGSYAARNMGIANSDGEILVFLDPDCRPRPGWLAAVLDSMRNPEVMIVLGRKHFAKSSHPLRVLAAYENQKTRWVLSNGNPCHVYGYTNNMAVRRSVFDQFGSFQERIRGGDTVFVQRVVHSLGVSVVHFEPRMEVDHLEITSTIQHYQKQAVYGGSNEKLGRTVPFRPLSNRQRLSIVYSMLRERVLSPWELGLLCFLLVPGALIYERGRKKAERDAAGDVSIEPSE